MQCRILRVNKRLDNICLIYRHLLLYFDQRWGDVARARIRSHEDSQFRMNWS